MNMDWDQCDHCGKMCLITDLNEDGLCPSCSADDSVVAAKEEEELLAHRWLRQWREGVEEAQRDIAKNGLPF